MREQASRALSASGGSGGEEARAASRQPSVSQPSAPGYLHQQESSFLLIFLRLPTFPLVLADEAYGS